MGKLLVPIVRENGSYRAHHAGEDHEFGDDGLPKFTAWLARTGSYWRVMDREAYEHAKAVPLAQEELFRDAARERLSAWLELAEERLAGTQVRLFLTGGNDDEPGVLELMEEHRSDRVVPCEGSVVDLDGEHTMITVGWSSPTPWDTWREAREDDLAAMIDEQAATVPDQGRCVFNLHCPPKDTPLDTCVALRAPDGEGSGELPEPIRIGARFQWTGGGSTAVREALRRYQPLVGLHGHIHESPGRFRMGRTQCFNPGSEYAQGQLRGWILTLRHGSLGVYQHTAG
jgi:Icc-related predicted phosphoesterase